MTCGSGAQIAQTQVSTQVQAVTTSIIPSVTTAPVGTIVTFTWNTNFQPCTLATPESTAPQPIYEPGTSFEDAQYVPGTYTYTIDCAGESASTQVTYTGVDPQATLTATPTTSPVNGLVALRMSFLADTLASPQCTASGGIPGDGWSGTSLQNHDAYGVTSSVARTVAYSVSCSYEQYQAHAQTQVTYGAINTAQPPTPPASVTLTASATTATVETGVKLTWSSSDATSCQAAGGVSGDGWSGTLALSGSMTVKESQAGSVSYDIACVGIPPAATAKATLSFTASSSTSGSGTSSGDGGGGGGSLDWLDIAALAGLALVGAQRRLSAGRR